MENLRFTQRVLHYFEFLVRDYGFVYADEFDLNPSFIDGGRFEGRGFDVVVRLGRRMPDYDTAANAHRNSLAVYFAPRDVAHNGQPNGIVHVLDLVDDVKEGLEPCPVVGEIRTRDKLDVALAYYARLLLSNFDEVLRSDSLPVPQRRVA